MPTSREAELKPLADATAGGIGALFTNCLLSPVDVAKTRIQSGRSKHGVIETIRQIVEEDGVHGLFKGLSVKSVETVLRNFLYFYVYEWAKARYHRLISQPGALGHTACGVVAGVSNITVTLPIDTLNVRMQASSGGQSAIDAARELIAEGPSGMWRGFTVSSILTLNPALTFAIFDSLKARLLKLSGSKVLTAAQAFLLGSLSKVIATVLTYPLMRAKSMLQAPKAKAAAAAASTNATTKAKDSGSVPKPPPERGILSVLRDVIEHEGIGGLYRGCSAQIFTAITKTGILLTTKEKIAAFAMAIVLLFDRKRRKKLQ